MTERKLASIDLNDADPADAINAFLHVMNRQRSMGLCPRTEHTLAEHLFRGDASIVFYSSAGGILSLVESRDIDPDDAHETIMFLLERRNARARKARAAAAEQANEVPA
jgi:hypothetical protein